MTEQDAPPTAADPVRAPAEARQEGLWRNGDFMKLWGGETLSQLGTQVSTIAIPLTAITVLGAGPGVVGLLATTQYLPVLLVSPFAGTWLDSHRCRPVLIAANFGRAVLIGLIPLAYVLHVLNLGLLLGVAFTAGILTAVFDVGYVTYLPKLVGPRQLTDANAKLESTYSIAGAGGPGLGGLLVQMFTPPLAVLADMTTYLVAGTLGVAIRHSEDSPPRYQRSFRAAVREGLAVVWLHPVLRAMLAQSAAFNLLGQVVFTLFLLYGVRELQLSPGTLGVVLSVGSLGGVVGAAVAGRAARVLGTGPTVVWSMALGSMSLFAIPAASGPVEIVVTVLVAGLILHELALGVFNVHSLSVRMRLIPPALLGRATASWRLVSTGTFSLAGVLAGILGEAVGVRTAMVVCLGVLTASCAAFLVGPVRSVDIAGSRTRC